ncbi:MAG TPA: hypothetical protein VHO69_07025 [Phototrophicaceae bacterium]|nr:hypothetical protein [Phototrophicaceae bacterium]
MANRAFWRALHSLAHPVTVWAVVLLLLNDHWFRFQWPSWWTGKLGDWAWLTFAPLICAAAVAWFVPKRLVQQEKVVGLLAFVFMGLWFALAKTVPFVHLLTTTTLDALVGWHGTLRLDTSDLLTLPALLVGWHIWRSSSNQALPIPRAWVVLALGVIGTLATSCMPADSGITHLCQQESKNFAFTGYVANNVFMSMDGGVTWGTVEARLVPRDCLISNRSFGQSWLLTSGSQTYRFVLGKAIYSYQDGQAETLEMNLSALGQEIRKIYYKGRPQGWICPGPVAYLPGPLDAVVDTKTGNLVVAMGLDGVLVKPPDNRWHWATFGQYHYVNLSQEMETIHFLQPEILTAVLLLFLIGPTIALNSEALGC